MYDFLAAGPGTFTFEPVPRFQVVGPNDITIIEADTANTHSVSITVTNGVSKRELSLGKRNKVACSNPEHAKYISDALDEARSLIMEAAKYIVDKGSKTNLYKAYFGTHDIFEVHHVYNAIAEPTGPMPLDCADSSDSRCDKNYNFLTGDMDRIYWCDAFYALPAGLDSICDEDAHPRGGVVIRTAAFGLEMAEYIEMDCEKSKGLSDDKKIRNAATFGVRLRPVVF